MISPLGERFLLTSVRNLQRKREVKQIFGKIWAKKKIEIVSKERVHSCHIMSLDLTR